MTFRVRRSSVVAAPKAAVWKAISSMGGVNDELSPWLRMTYPKGAGNLDGSVPLDRRLFRSVILLLGFIPVDLHGLRFTGIEPGVGFRENSSTLMQKFWKHTRMLEAVGEGRCQVTDEIEFEPRLPWVGFAIRAVVVAVFDWRHRRLARRFGSRVM